MKVLTVLGTRPEIIRLSLVIRRLDALCQHIVVHTGQNWDRSLSDIFFEELGVRAPDVHLGVRSKDFASQVGLIFERVGPLLRERSPDRVLVLGDTNSALAAVVAARLGIPVFHMEAGNRCYDERVPEETNRRVVDHCSTVLMPYTQRSAANLEREGIERERIFVTGNPILEVLTTHAEAIDASPAPSRLGVEPGRYFLATVHRAENVDRPARLASLVEGLSRVAESFATDLLVSVHPRTAARLAHGGIAPTSPRVRLLDPLSLFDFAKLERHAALVLSDSGTVQEECTILGVRSVVLRDVTERPETVECGSAILSGAAPDAIVAAAQAALALPAGWLPPPEYLVPDVSRTVAKIVLGLTSTRRHHSTP